MAAMRAGSCPARAARNREPSTELSMVPERVAPAAAAREAKSVGFGEATTTSASWSSRLPGAGSGADRMTSPGGGRKRVSPARVTRAGLSPRVEPHHAAVRAPREHEAVYRVANEGERLVYLYFAVQPALSVSAGEAAASTLRRAAALPPRGEPHPHPRPRPRPRPATRPRPRGRPASSPAPALPRRSGGPSGGRRKEAGSPRTGPRTRSTSLPSPPSASPSRARATPSCDSPSGRSAPRVPRSSYPVQKRGVQGMEGRVKAASTAGAAGSRAARRPRRHRDARAPGAADRFPFPPEKAEGGGKRADGGKSARWLRPLAPPSRGEEAQRGERPHTRARACQPMAGTFGWVISR